MDEQSIICPNCKTQIPFTEAIKEIKNKIKEESDLEFKSKENVIKNNIRIEYESKIKEAVEKTSKEKEMKLNDLLCQKNKIEEEAKQKIQNFQTIINKNDVEFKLKEKSLKNELQTIIQDNEENKKKFEIEISKKYNENIELFKHEIKREFDTKSQTLKDSIKQSNIDLQNLQETLIEKEKVFNNEKEKAFNKGKEETLIEKDIELKEKDIKLKTIIDQKIILEKNIKEKDIEIDEVRKEAFNKGRDDTLKIESDNYRFKILEKDKQLDNMKKIIDELKLKSEQGSQQIQGEIFEENLEKILIDKFPQDNILPVPKGIKGADILHKINNEKGLYCGTIIWEVKNTKTWNNEWINKLKDDQREIRADISVLMTKTLPKNINNFEYINGIFITDYKSVIGLSTTLRNSIIQIEITKQSLEGKDDKKEVLYKYLSSQEFRQKVESIVETFSIMKSDLDTEKRIITKTWAKREKQIERISNNTTKIYGDIQGLIGSSLLQIKNLEFEALTDGNDDNNIINNNNVNKKIKRIIKL